MKPQIIQLRCWLVLFSLAASLQITLGYYDPSNQRWINRDPLNEPGFEVRTEASSEHEMARNRFTFTENNPMTQVDATGLAPSIPKKVFFFPCPPGYSGYCFCACGVQGMRASPFCYWYRLGGHTFFVFDCGCSPWRR
jgi:RHS repeat-associated protein